ncbi:MAG: hypothetical protein J1E31_05485 [Helicobacter sp.]|nr:hypothetical protein [Helicobacter sp.]
MKALNLILILLWGFFSIGCGDSKSEFMYQSSDCNKVKTDCINQAKIDRKPYNQYMLECEKVRSMCAAVKAKGCLQDCQIKFGKGTPAAEQCKNRCALTSS